MRKLSSDYLYYQGLIGLIITPVVLVFFINIAAYHNFSHTTVIVLYTLLGIFTVFQAFKCYKTRQVLYDGSKVLIKTYFIKNTIEISVKDIIELKKVFSLAKKDKQNYFKLKYTIGDKRSKIYFFRSLELYNVDNFANYIGVKNNG
jgi:hypothetical protein